MQNVPAGRLKLCREAGRKGTEDEGSFIDKGCAVSGVFPECADGEGGVFCLLSVGTLSELKPAV